MLTFEKKLYRCSALEAESAVPSISFNKTKGNFKSTINDYEGLFIGYGNRETGYPYKEQNLYTGEEEKEINVAVLENECMKAEFLVDFGGRLWRLYDKKKQKDVLYTNDVIRFRNLSIRNSWFSGGIEWNCGIIGHTPFTCSQMYCAKVKGQGGEDVLRFYEFERVREIYYQIDFWLCQDKLMVRVRIENPNETVVPMYWWSNMATPEFSGGRVAVPADSAFNNSDGMGIKKSKIPFDGGEDVSYPQNIPDTIDYFYDIPEKCNKFIANVDADGKGLLQISSNNLKGRKLFSWGHRDGSAHWQKTLTDKAGWYVEIQAGLGKTQYECIPMPPKTSWSFLECYTLADIKKEFVNADYDSFVNEINSQVNSIYSSDELDMLCHKTESSIAKVSGECIFAGSGFGWLQNEFLHNAPAHLKFSVQDDISVWLSFLNDEKSENSDEILSFSMGETQKEFLKSRENQTTDWRIHYLLAAAFYDERDFISAGKSLCKAFLLDNNFYLNHLNAAVLYQNNDERFLYFAQKAIKQGSTNYSVCESVIRLLLAAEKYQEIIDIFPQIEKSISEKPRIQMYLSFCFLKIGDADTAEKILLSNGGLELIDFREGDKFLDKLYKGIRILKYGEEESKITVPQKFDFIVSKYTS